MKFSEADCSNVAEDGYLRAKWTSGPYSLVIAAYMFGQHRIQLWHKNEHSKWPDIYGPEVDTYKPHKAYAFIEKIKEALKDVSDKAPPKVVQLVFAAVALKEGWDAYDSRFRMDNLDKEPVYDTYGHPDSRYSEYPQYPSIARLGAMFQYNSALGSSYLGSIANDAIELANTFSETAMSEAVTRAKMMADAKIREGNEAYQALVQAGEKRAQELAAEISRLESRKAYLEEDVKGHTENFNRWDKKIEESVITFQKKTQELKDLQNRLTAIEEIVREAENPIKE